ncbi:hypothetical protein [Flavobacterium tibetense]|uniref:Replication initiation protein n=1 Tax=Flavobacterium tibetense TaxID=2233533 RepID=A0A365P3E9_9FLAO|nr:hypothetical protein [Flavobacterium tibetense]RBA29079.1 hypothetical protein DPN68_04785 [Flavobacterium tibetense]
MIDFVRIFYKDKFKLEESIMTDSRVNEVNCVFDYKSDELKYPYKSKIENVEINITNNLGFVYGSLHKFYNSWKTGEEQNYNDFTYSNLIEVIDYLSLRIVDFDIIALTQLEVGLNLDLEISPKEFLEKNVHFHSFKGFNRDINYSGGGKMFQFDYTQFYIKIYDKGKMYKQKKNILRFELKLFRKSMFQELGVYNISDLRDKNKLRKLFILLTKRFDEMLIIDDYSEKNIDKKDLILLNKYTNPRFWNNEIKNKTRTTKANHVRKLNQLLEKYDLTNLKSSLKLQLLQKYLQFINN